MHLDKIKSAGTKYIINSRKKPDESESAAVRTLGRAVNARSSDLIFVNE